MRIKAGTLFVIPDLDTVSRSCCRTSTGTTYPLCSPRTRSTTATESLPTLRWTLTRLRLIVTTHGATRSLQFALNDAQSYNPDIVYKQEINSQSADPFLEALNEIRSRSRSGFLLPVCPISICNACSSCATMLGFLQGPQKVFNPNFAAGHDIGWFPVHLHRNARIRLWWET